MSMLAAVASLVAAMVWHNGRHLLPARWREGAATVVTVIGATFAAWWLFTRSNPARGLEGAWGWTLAALVIAGLVAVAARVSRRVGAAVADRRMQEMGSSEFALHVGWRIPVLTAFAEEVVYRGAVWWLLERAGGSTLALFGTSVAFALGHVVVARDQAIREGRRVVPWVVVTIGATGAAGILLGLLRLSTGGIWAPMGVHAAVNMALAVGARHARDPDGPVASAAEIDME